MLQHHPIESSVIAAVAYDSAKHQLDVCLHDGARYRYYDVPLVTYQQLLRADSKGRFFNSAIKRMFSFERLGGHSSPTARSGFFDATPQPPARPRPTRARRGFFDD
jgi:hypothetical protein